MLTPPWALANEPDTFISRQDLIQDIRELNHVFESAHPDPYLNSGGKVAYHRHLQALIGSIPAEGMTRSAFHSALEPFVASLGDGHTSLERDTTVRGRQGGPGGLPLLFEVVEGLLYVESVFNPSDLPLIGARLDSIEGVTLDEIIARELNRRGHDNRHHALSALTKRGALYYGESLNQLVPEWNQGAPLTVSLELPSGELFPHTFSTTEDIEGSALVRESRIRIPGRDARFGFHFPSEDRQIAYLWIDDMTSYREMYEYSSGIGSLGWQGWARRVYELVHGAPAPDALDEVIAGIPAATMVFQSLFREMKAAGTETLIIDLRHNFGGNDLMVPILLYFMVGFDHTVSLVSQTATVQKTSSLLDRSSSTGVQLDQISYHNRVPLRLGDYDFSLDSQLMASPELRRATAESLTRMLRHAPTFHEVFAAHQDEALYRPRRILVLSDNGTQSSGFDLLTQLVRLGAEVVGVTPSQAGNCFGNIRQFRLGHSGISGWVSTKYFIAYPNQAPIGFALAPDHPLTYQDLVDREFDPHACLLLAMELARSTHPRLTSALDTRAVPD